MKPIERNLQAVPTLVDPLLLVDLDGTLINTDTLWECLILLAKQNPLSLFLVPFWLLKGRVNLKRQLAVRVRFSPQALPYRKDLIEFLAGERARGRKLWLVSGADKLIASKISDYVGLFSEVIASDGVNNLVGEKKLEAVKHRLGDEDFDYLGDSSLDLPLWRSTGRVWIVPRSQRTLEAARRVGQLVRVFPKEPLGVKGYAKALRIHQWVKNTLLWVPLILAHKFDAHRLTESLFCFLSFSLCASGVYLLNDLWDLEFDRTHPDKRRRPLASGQLSIPHGLQIAAFLFAAAFTLAFFLLSRGFLELLMLYAVTTTAYSVYFSRQIIADVLILAFLYTLRLYAGAVAADVIISPWLLAFAMFFFLSLAFLKRYADLVRLESSGFKKHKSGYESGDLHFLLSLGPPAGYIAVLVLALYVNSPQVRELYPRPEFLWLICPLLLFWTIRMWMKTHRREMTTDPILFTMSDKGSYGILVLVTLSLALALW